MIGQFKVITLCGSMRFKKDFFEIQKGLTLAGYIVLMPCIFNPLEDDTINQSLTIEQRQLLADIHRCKIDISDEILVVNRDGYIGVDTHSEIVYAEAKGVFVRYFEIHNIKLAADTIHERFFTLAVDVQNYLACYGLKADLKDIKGNFSAYIAHVGNIKRT